MLLSRKGAEKERATITNVEQFGVVVSLWDKPWIEPFFVTAEQVELAAEQPSISPRNAPDFKEGDRVRYVGKAKRYHGRTATVTEIWTDHRDRPRVAALFDNDENTVFDITAEALEHVTETAVYAGKPNLVHIPNGKRQGVGRLIANAADALIREAALRSDGEDGDLYNPLCPGCYMVAIFNAAVALAEANGQSLTELGRCMAKAFEELETKGISAREDIEVSLDHC